MVATDERADFAAFVRSYGNTMKRLGHAVSGDPDIAEDATQSALIKVFKHWHEIEHPRAYARRAVVSECIDRGRRLQREKVAPAGEWGTLPGERGTSPQDQEAWEMREALWQAVRRLPPRQRAVLALRYFESLTDSEIADVLAISAGAVRSTASRALGALRLIYTEDEK